MDGWVELCDSKAIDGAIFNKTNIFAPSDGLFSMQQLQQLLVNSGWEWMGAKESSEAARAATRVPFLQEFAMFCKRCAVTMVGLLGLMLADSLFIEAAGHRECVCQVGYQRASFLPAAACHMTSGMMNFLAFSWMVLIGLLQAGWDGSVVDMAMGSSTSGRSCGWNQAAVHRNE